MSKKNKKQRLEESLNEAINPKPAIDRAAVTRSLLGNYRPNENKPASTFEEPSLAETNIVASAIDTEPLAFRIKLASNHETEPLADTGKIASSKDTNQLAEEIPPANLLAQTPELLAPLPEKSANTASKLAELNDPASRSPLQLLADLRKFKGTRVQVAIRIRPEIKQLIDVFMAKEGMNQQDFFEQSASIFIENHDKQLAELNIKDASLLAHNDRRLRTLYKTKPRIIYLYHAYAENTRWSANDDAKASALNEVDLRIIELGILQTLGNRKQKGKINSFGYFLPEIQNFLEIEMPEEGIEAMLMINRKSFQRLTGKSVDLSFLDEKRD